MTLRLRVPDAEEALRRAVAVPARGWSFPWRRRRRAPDPREAARRSWQRHWQRLVADLVASEGGSWWGRRGRALRRRPWILVARTEPPAPTSSHDIAPAVSWRTAGPPARLATAVLVPVTWCEDGQAAGTEALDPIDARPSSAALAPLRRVRRRPGIELVVLRLPVSLLAPEAGARRAAVAHAVRHAMRGLREEAGAHCPLHLVFEGLEGLPGFGRFVRGTARARRERPWGWREDASDDPSSGFEAWWARMADDVLARFHACTDADPARATRRRVELFALPRRLRAWRAGWLDLRGRLVAHHHEGDGGGDDAVAEEDRGEREASGTWLRGVWFTGDIATVSSSTPTPTPLSGLLDAAWPFLGDLVARVWPAEAQLATTSLSWQRREARRRLAWQVLAAGLALVLCTWRAVAWWQEGTRVGRMDREVQALRPRAAAASEAWPLLAALGELARGDALASSGDAAAAMGPAASAPPPARWKTGRPSATVRLAARQARDRLAGEAWWPRLQARLLDRLGPDLPLDERYDALRVWCMLRDPGHLDAGVVAAWWRDDLARGPQSPADDRLDPGVLASLLAAGPPAGWLEPPGQRVAQARAALRGRPLADAVLARWRVEEASRPATAFRPSEAAGPDAAQVFRRASGEPLSAPLMPGVEAEALQRLARRAPALARALVDESAWVLGEAVPDREREARVQSAVDDARRVQDAVAAREWQRLLGDLSLAGGPAVHGEDFAGLAQRLSQPGSPLERLVRAVAAARGVAAGRSSAAPPSSAPRGADLAAASRADVAADDMGSSWQRWAADAGDASSPLARLREAFREAATQWRTPDGEDRAAATLPAGEAAAEGLRRVVADAPAPVRRWIEGLVDRWQAAHRARRARAWQTAADEDLGGWCRQAVAGRYPFDADGRDEVPLADLVALFGPGGRFDQFAARPAGGEPSGTEASTLKPDLPPALRATLAGAARVRDAFFGAGRGTGNGSPSAALPALGASLRLVALTPAGAEVRVTASGQVATLRHADDPPLRWTWPASAPASLRVELVPPPADARPPVTVAAAAGPWALFRLLEAGRVRPVGPPRAAERRTLSFAASGVQAVFEWQADSVRHPWGLEALRAFRCPAGGAR